MCAVVGEPYVDYQFPTGDKILYIEEEDGKTWQCFVCKSRNLLPPIFSPPRSMEE